MTVTFYREYKDIAICDELGVECMQEYRQAHYGREGWRGSGG